MMAVSGVLPVSDTGVGRIIYPVRYGWVICIKCIGIILLFVLTVFLCLGSYWKNDVDFHAEEVEREQGVTVTAIPGYISAHTWTPDNSNWHLVVSDSSVPVDAVAKAKDEHVLYTYENLKPGGSFWFESEEPFIISVVAG